MSTNPGQEGALAPQEHGAHQDAGISRFFFGQVPAGVHGGLKHYGILAIFLAVITLIEFLIIIPPDLQGAGISIAPLVILSVIKFFCVVAFFMHLKFEHPLLWQIFVAGLALGLVVALALVLLFGVFRPTPRAFSENRQEAFQFQHHPAEEPHYEQLVVPTPAPPGAVAPAPSAGAAATGGSPGQQLFAGAGGCAACHTIEGVAAGVLGPPLDNIATIAEGRIPEQSAAEYIRDSITDPDAYTVEGFQEGLMQATMAGIPLSDADVEALVEYLLTLR